MKSNRRIISLLLAVIVFMITFPSGIFAQDNLPNSNINEDTTIIENLEPVGENPDEEEPETDKTGEIDENGEGSEITGEGEDKSNDEEPIINEDDLQRVFEERKNQIFAEINALYDEIKEFVKGNDEKFEIIQNAQNEFNDSFINISSIEELDQLYEIQLLKIGELKDSLSNINDELAEYKKNIIEEITIKYEDMLKLNVDNEEIKIIQDYIEIFTVSIEMAASMEEIDDLYTSELNMFKMIEGIDTELGENPDNLPGPIEIEAPFIESGFIDENLKSMSRMSKYSGELEPGEVKMTKTATPVEGMVNTWDIEIRVEGQNISSSSDIVLLIDISQSMEGSKLKAATKAAVEFANQLLNEENIDTRIAVVSFSDKIKIEQGLTKDKQKVLNAIKGLSVNGGTFTQAGINQAVSILKDSNAKLKNIVLLSDGVPTYSYGIKNPNNYTYKYDSSLFADYYETTENIPKEEYIYNRTVGDGTGLRTRYEGIFNRKYYNHGNSAIAEANFAKNDGNTIYTISLESDNDGKRILNKIASQNKSFTGSSSDLSRIFNEIGGDIILAAKEAKVSDPMGQGFTVFGKASDISVSTGKYSYDSDKKHIDWIIGTLSEPILPGSDIKFATMKYRVEIDDDILNATPSDGKNYLTNGETVLEYTDNNNNRKRIYADVPSADPIILALEKKLINSLGFEIKAKDMGSDERFFDIHVTSDQGYDHTYKLNAGQKSVMTNLRLEDTYTVIEDKFSGNTTHSASDYEISYNIYGKDTDKFIINQGDSDTPVIVTNRELPLGELTVTKLFNPGVTKTKRSLSAPEFKFELIGPKKADGTSSLDGIKGLALENGKYVFILKAGESKTFKNLPYAEYQVVEIETNGFIPSYSTSEGKITLKIDQKVGEVMVTNTPKDDDKTIEVKVEKVWDGGLETNPSAIIELWRKGLEKDGKTPIDESVENFTATKVKTLETFKNLAKFDPSGREFEYYVKETKVPTNYTVDYSGDQATGFKVYNTYKSSHTELEVTKIWTGDEKVTRPVMNVELWRKVGDKEEKVEGAEVKEFTETNTVAKWTGLEKTDAAGKEYEYFAKEDFKDKTDINNENWILGKYDKDNKSFTNSVKAPTGKLTITKILENEPSSIARRSLLNSEPLLFKVKVTGHNFEGTVELKAGQSFTIEGLYSGEYKVEEVEAYGYAPVYTPEGGKIEVRADKTSQVTITNTNTGGGETNIEVTVEKVWEGGLETNPSTTIELWRKGVDLADKEIDESVGEFIATKDKTSEIFKNLAKNDPSGRAFEYYVKEPTVPDNYKASIEGFTVTNTYLCREDLIGTKTWEHGDNPEENHPEEITVILKANGTKVDSKKVRRENDWMYEFEGQPISNEYGKIVYTIDEEDIPNYEKEILGLDIKNIFKNPEVKLTNKKTDNLNGSKVRIGDSFKYYITIKNEGENTVKDIKVTDRVPRQLDILSVEQKDSIISGQTIEYTVPTIKAGETFTLTIEVEVNSKARDKDIIKNVAVVNDKDIPSRELEVDDWHIIWWDYLDRANHYSYLVGYPDGTVRPEAEITRGEVATIFYRMMTEDARDRYRSRENNYSDVNRTDWYNIAISTLSNAGALEGYPDGSFRPERSITRGEFAAMASRFLSEKGSLTDNKFTDIRGNRAEKAIEELASHGLINGYPDGSFRPNKEITRAEAVTLVNSILDRTPHKDKLIDGMETWPDNNRGAWYYAQIQEATNSHEYERANTTTRETWTKLLPNKDWTLLE
ncbi:MAG: Cna B-type domain-containing protein [Tissierellia bacterium]|nr:Cna B-type domain-containing protein [Tissierellia bacterium]